MRFGVFSDVHGNRRALDAVWSALAADGLTEHPVFNAGDNVGYGDAPLACIDFLREHPHILGVRGNYDKNVALFPEREAEYRRKWGKLRPEKYAALRDDSALLPEDARAWLLALPAERTLEVEGHRLILTHYSPGGKEGLGSWTPDKRLAELAGGVDADVVLVGHTHTPFARRAEGVLFVNPGSVGRSRWRRASYVVLTLEPGVRPSAELRQAPLP